MDIKHHGGGVPARPAWFTTLLGIMALLGLVLSACAGPESGQTDGDSSGAAQAGAATRTSEGGQVTVKVTWDGTIDPPAFTVVMDTHAVDLDGYDLGQLAVLRTDQGQEMHPAAWVAPKGGHHREGQLTFPAIAADGGPLIGPGTRAIELVLRDVAGVPERIFRWTL